LFRKTELPASPESSFVTVQGRKLEVRTIAGTLRTATSPAWCSRRWRVSSAGSATTR